MKIRGWVGAHPIHPLDTPLSNKQKSTSPWDYTIIEPSYERVILRILSNNNYSTYNVKNIHQEVEVEYEGNSYVGPVQRCLGMAISPAGSGPVGFCTRRVRVRL
jgi:hypothetical protein